MSRSRRNIARRLGEGSGSKAKWYWLWLSFAVILLDLFSKYLAVKFLDLHTAVGVFPGFNFYLAHNKGSAFSFLAEAGGWQHWFFIVIAIILSILILIWMGRMSVSQRWGLAGLSLILSGAIGNAINRLYSGYVIDFVDLYIKSYHWPTFNIADMAICLGVIFLIINEGSKGA